MMIPDSRKLILYILLQLISVNLFAQLTLDDVNMKKIPQKKIREFIMGQKKLHIHNFRDLMPSCCTGQDQTTFCKIEKKYQAKENINQLWKKYKSASPAVLWKSKSVNFGFMYSMNDDNIMYSDGSYTGIQQGQILYLNMKMMGGIYNLALAFEIIRVDDEDKIIEFSYVQGGKAKGKQIIKLLEMPDGTTQIIHSSVYKSNSHFRDRRLYPLFHNKATKQFHQNVQKSVLM